MKLVGKKLYRTGPLKLFNQFQSPSKSGQPQGPSPEELEKKRKAAEKARKLAEAKKLVGDTRMQEWEATAKKDLFDPEQKALYERRKQLAEDVGSGAAARRGACAARASARPRRPPGSAWRPRRAGRSLRNRQPALRSRRALQRCRAGAT